MPKWGKSGSGLDPALAPRTCSSSKPTQPLLRSKFSGTTMPSCSAISPKVKPASACARCINSFSEWGIWILITGCFFYHHNGYYVAIK